MTGSPVVEVRGLSKRYGAETAIDRVDLRIENGEIVVLLGPNGAGKTTLLRLLAGMTVPDEGTARLGGFDIVGDRRRAAAVTGVVTATEHTWYLRLSGVQNLEFFAGLHGMRRRAARSAAARALEDAALGAHADKPVGAYSRGMRARLAIARAQLGDPSVLLLDEPTAGLDAGSAAQFQAQIAGRRRGAVLLATHSAPEAAALADRALVLGGGRLVRELGGPLNEADVADVLGAG